MPKAETLKQKNSTKVGEKTINQVITVSIPKTVTQKQIFWAIFEAMLFIIMSFAMAMNIESGKWLMVALDAVIILSVVITNL